MVIFYFRKCAQNLSRISIRNGQVCDFSGTNHSLQSRHAEAAHSVGSEHGYALAKLHFRRYTKPDAVEFAESARAACD